MTDISFPCQHTSARLTNVLKCCEQGLSNAFQCKEELRLGQSLTVIWYKTS